MLMTFLRLLKEILEYKEKSNSYTVLRNGDNKKQTVIFNTINFCRWAFNLKYIVR